MHYEEIESLCKEAGEQNKQSNYAEAERLCKLALEKLSHFSVQDRGQPEAKPKTEGGNTLMLIANLRARLLSALTDSFFWRGMNQEALPLAEEALHLSIQAGNKEQEAKLLNSIGRVYKNLSNYPLALEYYNKALSINEQIGNKAGVAADTGNIGQVHINLSDFPRALEYHTRSLAINEEIGNKAGVAANSANIGIVYGNLSDLPRALEYMTKALTINEEVGNKLGVAMATGNIGNVYNGIPDYPRALEFYSKALAMDEEIGHKIGVARNTGNIGNVHYSLSNYPLALEYLTKALALTVKIGYKNGVANNNRDIGRLYGIKYFEGYNADKAEDYLLKAINMYAEIGVKSFDVHQILAELYKSLKRWEEALAQFERYHQLEKEVLSEEANKLAHQIETRRKIEEAERDAQLKLARFQGQEKILLNILPVQIAEQIISGKEKIIQRFDSATVLFADVVGFTKWSEGLSLDEVAETLNQLFNLFDELATEHGVEKIKTIGDAYMCVAGLPEPCDDHAERMAKMALAMNQKIAETYPSGEIKLRIGIHCGEVIAGVIGKNKYAYDLWGDTVNTASRMESHGVENKIQVSEEFRNQLGDKFSFKERGEIDVKGKGKMKTWFLNPPTRS